MKVLLALLCSLALVSCATKKEAAGNLGSNYDFEKDPILSKYRSERQARDQLSFEKIENQYQDKKRASFYFLPEVINHAMNEKKMG